MDGEIGRFEFSTFDVKHSDKGIEFKGTSLFPYRKGKQWYQTCGFKEMALMNGAAQRPYRQTVKVFNRVRRQETGGTPSTSLRDNAETEGLKVIDFLEKKSACILSENGFDVQGAPKEDCPVVIDVKDSCPCTLEEKKVFSALEVVCEDMRKRELSSEMIKEVREKTFDTIYEEHTKTAYIYIDDVGVKEQKKNRKKIDKQGSAHDKKREDKRPTVQNTVARVEYNGNGFTLTGKSVMQVLWFALAFVLENRLVGLRLMFITDGQRSLQKSIKNFLSWHPFMFLLLDWFHLVKKFKEELSLACKGREIRNRHLRELLPLLWFGLIDRAKVYLQEIPAEDVKNTGAIKRLDGYLERNSKGIPCYALRSKLKLPNSSNPVERSNNLVTSKRQKHNGMSWSEDGSYALTALKAVVLNGGVKLWVRKHIVSFEIEIAT